MHVGNTSWTSEKYWLLLHLRFQHQRTPSLGRVYLTAHQHHCVLSFPLMPSGETKVNVLFPHKQSKELPQTVAAATDGWGDGSVQGPGVRAEIMTEKKNGLKCVCHWWLKQEINQEAWSMVGGNNKKKSYHDRVPMHTHSSEILTTALQMSLR